MGNKIINFIERWTFGVCTYLSYQFGIKTSIVRMYFIYVSFVAFGSPIFLYLILAFWLNIKKYLAKNPIVESSY